MTQTYRAARVAGSPGSAHVAAQQAARKARTAEELREQMRASLRSTAADEGNRCEVNAAGVPFPFMETSQAFIDPIVNQIEQGGGLGRAIYTLAYLRESTLPIAGDSMAALRAGAAQSSYQLFDAAIPTILREYASGPYLTYDDASVFRAIIESLGAANNWPRNAQGQQVQAQTIETTQRARLIASILQGKDAFQIYGGHPGEAKRLMTFPASELNNLTIEKLREIESAVLDLRRQRGQTREERQQELADRARDARGYDNQPQRTELDRPIEIADGAGRHYTSKSDAGGQAAPGRMDRMPAVTVNPAENSLFTNPATGNQYRKKEVHALAGGDATQRALFRKMMNTNLSRLNTILAGE